MDSLSSLHTPNPYLPVFANQRPRINEPLPTPQLNFSGIQYGQIHPVNGFDGARAYANSLANGASEILPDSDPNVARIYMVAKDANGQVYLQGCAVTPIEEPKPITMDDLSSQMSQILERLNKLEADKNDQSVSGNAAKNARQFDGSGNQSVSRTNAGYAKSNASDVQSGNAK